MFRSDFERFEMNWIETSFVLFEFIMREAALFAALGFVVLGASDLGVDFIWLGLEAKRRLPGSSRDSGADALGAPARPGRFAIFIPAWDESAVIGAMLTHARSAFDGADHRIYVGCYPNDPATVAAVWRVLDERIRLVIGPAGIM